MERMSHGNEVNIISSFSKERDAAYSVEYVAAYRAAYCAVYVVESN